MRLLCFQAKRFWWKPHSQAQTDVNEEEGEKEVKECLVVFFHAEAADEDETRRSSVLRQSLKHIKWLANKRKLNNVVLHPFAHLGGEDASPAFARTLLTDLAKRLRDADCQVWLTPFGYSCQWDLNVHGDSLAKVWKEI